MIHTRKPKCLLVDDLEDNIFSLRQILKETDLECLSSNSGEKALELLLEHDFALAIIDVQMPVMNGLELGKIMKSSSRTKFIPIIFVTAGSENIEKVFQGYQAGAVDYLIKPLSPQILIGKVNVFLMLDQQKNELNEKIERLRKAEESLQRNLKSKDDFLSICSHEIKTPLTALKLLFDMKLSQAKKVAEEIVYSPKAMKKFMMTAEVNLDRLIHLVNDMLDLSKVSEGKLQMDLEEFDLSLLVQDIVLLMKTYLDSVGCEVRLNLENNVLGHWDHFRVGQVITSLLTNVGKYAPGRPVEISVKKAGSKAYLEIRDYGPGISEADKERIFQKFERAVPYTSVSGLGIGLFISKKIVELHGGNIQVLGHSTEGSTFQVALPLAPNK